MTQIATTRRVVRPEIQALRAAAVLLVVLFHLWPSRIPGGYVGVDIFFVISGFLITGHLLREVDKRGTVQLAHFWARRARRLLPASLLVAAVTAAATIIFVPMTFWRDWLSQVLSSVFYVVNWQLARDSVDYLASDNSASPIQHYWSLSVEEQFYVAWPLLILLCIFIANKVAPKNRRITIAVGLLLIVCSSLGYSMYATAASPEAAYFVTTTRAWEFGLGGLVSFLPDLRSRVLRALISWLGVIGILLVAFKYTSGTPFPGIAALVPVLSAAFIIWGGGRPFITNILTPKQY